MGECTRKATEGASSKKTLGTNLSGRGTTSGRNSGERGWIETATKGVGSIFLELNSQVKGQRRVNKAVLPFFCPFLRPKKAAKHHLFPQKNGKAANK